MTPPKDINGKIFLDLLNNPSLPGPEYALSYNQSYGPPFRGQPRMYAVTLRSRVYRYIQCQKDLAEGDILFRELYDHRSDPDETNNLSAKEPKVVKRFEKMLREHLD